MENFIFCAVHLPIKYKTWQSGCTIKASLISNEISHARQFESRDCKYDMIKRLSNSNLNLKKCASSIQLLWDQIDVKSKNLSRGFASLAWILQARYWGRVRSKFREIG